VVYNAVLYVNSSLRLIISFVFVYSSRDKMVKLRMNNLSPLPRPDPQSKARSVSARRTRRAVVGLLVGLIALAMIVWLSFLGWGMVELVRALANFMKNAWTTFV
jgi:Flp pilus assembly pilin Flp